MADVLIVCVREDEPKAKALADMFEAAGFSIGGAPSNDAALRSSGAGVVVWSQASIRSRPFLDAAQRVINANKAVVASLIEPPPPSSIGDSAAFDLSLWDGDPDDPALDPLFFAVDRMVNSARAAVGATPAEPAPARFEPPPSLRPPPAPRPPPRPTPQPPQPAAGDQLAPEAEHWRTIRHSRDPAVFLDYLARYGQDGAFADVAELRLKQLTGRGAETSQPVRAQPLPPRHAEPPPPRYEPPPPRFEPPRVSEPAQGRRAEPPQRRADPPPLRREPPSHERAYERAGAREPPRGEGGALRAFILIALLGGAALGGGLYFGGAMGDKAATQEEVAGDATATAPETAGGDPETAQPPASDAGVSLAEASRTPPQTERRETREAQPERTRPEPEPTRTPTTNAASEPPSTQLAASTTTPPPNGTGPVSLNPGANTDVGLPSTPETTPPSLPTASTPVSSPQPTARPARRGDVVWARRPSARGIADAYPQRALRDGLGGRVELDCTVRASLALTCTVASETPAGQGFSRAALGAASSYRARDTLSDGASAVGARTRIVVQFQAPQ